MQSIGVGRVRKHPGRGDQRGHQAGRRAVPVAVRVRAAIRIDGKRSSSRSRTERNPRAATSATDTATSRPASAVGSPRSTLVLYGAYQYLRDYDSQPGADPAFPRCEQDKVFAKLTWRLTPALQMMQSFHEEFWENPDPPTLAAPYETTLRRHASVPSSTFANVTYAPTGQNVWDLRVGRASSTSRTTPAPAIGPRRTSRCRHRDFERQRQGNGRAEARSHHRQGRVQSLSIAWLGANHELKAGIQLERGEHRLSAIIPGGVRYVDSGGPFQAEYRAVDRRRTRGHGCTLRERFDRPERPSR